MLKKMLKAAVCLGLIGSTAFAARTIDVPGQYKSLQAAIDAADAGDTIRLSSSDTFIGNISLDKPIKLMAAPNQSPRIQNTTGTLTAQVIFGDKSGGSQIGSASGGRITFQYYKITTGTTPAAMVQFNHAGGSQIVVENVDILTTGPAKGIPITAIIHDKPNASAVTLRNVDINVNRNEFAGTKIGAAYGIIIGGLTNANTLTTGGDGPIYNLERVRIKNYTRAAIWPNFANARINMSYCDCGKLGESMTRQYPYGTIVSNLGSAPWSGTLDHSIFYGPYAYHAMRIGSNGSSVTLNRCAVISKYAFDRRSPIGALYLSANQQARPGRVNVTLDHCDVIDMSRAGWNSAALLKDNPGGQFTTITLTVRNSNIYSQHNKATNLILVGGDSIDSRYNNVFGQGVNVGYKPGEHDMSVDPQYADPQTGDLRYNNTALNTADSDHGPIGIASSHGNIWAME